MSARPLPKLESADRAVFDHYFPTGERLTSEEGLSRNWRRSRRLKTVRLSVALAASPLNVGIGVSGGADRPFLPLALPLRAPFPVHTLTAPG